LSRPHRPQRTGGSMRHHGKRPLLARLAPLIGVAALASSAPALGYSFDAQEASYDQLYASTPVALTGHVVDASGAPIAGAQVTLIAWGANAANNGASATTDANGVFSFSALSRRASLMQITAPGCYTEIIPVDLQRPMSQGSLDVGGIDLVRKQP